MAKVFFDVKSNGMPKLLKTQKVEDKNDEQ